MVAKTSDPSGPDGDADGVADACDAFPTNPQYQQDSDGDGLPDSYEIAIGTNPNIPDANAATLDSDGDGYTDIVEIHSNSDPLNNTSVPPSPQDADVPTLPGMALAFMAALLVWIQAKTQRSKPVLLFLLAGLIGIIAPDLQAGVTYFHHDAQGSVVAATNETGNLLWRKHYEPYGREYGGQVSTADAPEQYAGKPHEDRTGLTFMGARHYDPLLGRFISTDPAGLDESNLTSFNRYCYANNNPYLFVDPDGHVPVLIPLIAFIAKEAAGEAFEQATGVPAPTVKNAGTYLAKEATKYGAKDVAKGAGRSGKQTRLRELANDDNLGSSDRGWIQQEINSIERAQRKNIRNPPGKDLAHERGREASKGYGYEHSNLQDRDLHRVQHKYDNFGRKNKERPPQ